jgi:acyl-CoA synthetase (AMP-forming)/AMP-acid ligase II
MHAPPGDRAILMYPPGLEFIEAFLTCLAAEIIAIPAYPPPPNRIVGGCGSFVRRGAPLTEQDFF